MSVAIKIDTTTPMVVIYDSVFRSCYLPDEELLRCHLCGETIKAEHSFAKNDSGYMHEWCASALRNQVLAYFARLHGTKAR